MNPNCLLFHKERERERERESPKSSREGVGGWCDGAWKIFSIQLIWIIEGQGSIALAVGAGRGCLDIFSLVYLFSFLSHSLGDGTI